MAKRKQRARRKNVSLVVAVQAIADRLAALEERFSGVDMGAAVLVDAMAKEIRSMVEQEVDDLMSDLRIER